MATQRKSPPAPPTVTAERAARLHRLLRLLADGPQSRTALTRQLHYDVRSFYRDLWLLREFLIDLPLHDGRYTLSERVDAAVARLPFPDPMLTLGEALELAKGKSAAHRKLRQQIDLIVQEKGAKKAKLRK